MMKMQTEAVKYSSNNSNQSNYVKKSAENTSDKFSQLLAETKEEFAQKLETGETKQSYAIGANSYTEEEWNKLVKGFDRIQEQLREEAENDARQLREKSEDNTPDNND